MYVRCINKQEIQEDLAIVKKNFKLSKEDQGNNVWVKHGCSQR